MAAVACSVAALGCGAPAALLLPPPSPPEEVLAWFPEDSFAVALIETDPDRPGVARALAALTAVAPKALERAPSLEQMRPLLGNELAVGVVAPGEAPLAVLVTKDAWQLDVLAEAWVKARRAAYAGRYRGADLHTARGYAFAVRGDLLLVSRTTADLRRALDRRTDEDGLREEDLPDADADLRGRVDPRVLLARADARLRAVPWLAGVQRVDVVADAGPDGLAVRLSLDTRGEELVELDVPITDGRGPRIVDVPGERIGVRDLSHVFGVAGRAAEYAAPLALVRFAPVLPAARRLASALHGPATLIRRGRRLLLRADPSRPGRAARALDRVVRLLSRAGVDVRRGGGFDSIGPLRFGVREGVIVAGTVGPRALERLARAPLARPAGVRGSLAFRSSRHGVTGWATATPRRTTVDLRISWP